MREHVLILFAGQSNMAGRGIVSQKFTKPAPTVLEGAGFEFRAVSDPARLYPMAEPFGKEENRPGGIFEPGMKTGSCVSAFTNAWYEACGLPVIGVSAAKGGSRIASWQGENDYLTDAVERLRTALDFCKKKQIPLADVALVWCQGETDGDLGTEPQEYLELTEKTFAIFKNEGIRHIFLCTIGEYNGQADYDYGPIRQAQLTLPSRVEDLYLVSDCLHTMKKRGLMKDDFHYYQEAYNELGTEAGNNAGTLEKEFLSGKPYPA